jgi:hypothetical protein
MKVSIRVSLWKANGQRCLYCGELIEYRELEIDHLIPESTDAGEFKRIREDLCLDATFTLQDIRNLVPTHHDCNRKKRDTQFNSSSLRYYIGLWTDKQKRIQVELHKFEEAASRDELLSRLAHQVEIGTLSRSEIDALLNSIATPKQRVEAFPTVVSFSQVCSQLDVVEGEVKSVLTKLRGVFKRPLILAEPWSFSGETLSVRFAIWNLDVDKLEKIDLGKWELLEVDAASDIYGLDSARALGEAINESYNIFYAEKNGCPECGGKVTMSGSSSESGELAIATCEQCGWEDYFTSG